MIYFHILNNPKTFYVKLCLSIKKIWKRECTYVSTSNCTSYLGFYEISKIKRFFMNWKILRLIRNILYRMVNHVLYFKIFENRYTVNKNKY